MLTMSPCELLASKVIVVAVPGLAPVGENFGRLMTVNATVGIALNAPPEFFRHTENVPAAASDNASNVTKVVVSPTATVVLAVRVAVAVTTPLGIPLHPLC
jgi:hypothetical protein